MSPLGWIVELMPFIGSEFRCARLTLGTMKRQLRTLRRLYTRFGEYFGMPKTPYQIGTFKTALLT